MFRLPIGRGGAVALAVVICALMAAPAMSAPGVGVSLGSIVVEDKLTPGSAYNLPGVDVINTGDETREYSFSFQPVDVEGMKRPDAGWFHFEPGSFVLQPGQSRTVETRIVLPTGAEPGDYAAHLEAHPVASGNFTISIAAATKLTFTVQPASWFDAQRHRVNRWLDDYMPWTYIVPGLLALAFFATKAGRLPFRLRLERK